MVQQMEKVVHLPTVPVGTCLVGEGRDGKLGTSVEDPDLLTAEAAKLS